MSSSRLPGKVMQDLAGKPILQHVLERCRRIENAQVVVCAIADEPTNAPLIATARASGVEVFVGPVHDVLERYRGAAHSVAATEIVRVTSDCPLIDPEICGAVIRKRAGDNADYASNLTPRSYPKGLDCEVFSLELLDRAARAATETFDREHVTQWMLRAADVKRSNVSSGDVSLASYRWTLDYPADLEFMRRLVDLIPVETASFADILATVREHPELPAINAGLTDGEAQKTTKDTALHA